MTERSGYRTTEFWLALVAVIVGALLASGALGAGSTLEVIVGAVAQVLASVGYAGARFGTKKADALRRASESATARAPTVNPS